MIINVKIGILYRDSNALLSYNCVTVLSDGISITGLSVSRSTDSSVGRVLDLIARSQVQSSPGARCRVLSKSETLHPDCLVLS